ncbi:methyltransferase [Bordetella sp. H567]|uniref:class I SAM-dependent methyltransferase n=1 Tax=Bordetella sp. H567 TaxID=1697043 RepID=UPI00081CB38B|nr:class I SAM-dependent methyltransferase [Bordetella sp. H567]AOB33599.1 methyltransferase [Bordetella sp. H567]
MSEILYEQRDFPVFQNRMYATRAAARQCPKGDIRLAQDPNTGIVANLAFRPELMVYDEHYQNEQGNSPSFQRHLADVGDIVERLLGRQSLVEVGCGKGYFLETLADRGCDIAGFDPAYEGENPRIRRELFAPSLVGRGAGLILRHVLEHIQDPLPFLRQLAQANGHAGRIYIEVPCLDWILAHKAWFDFFYEHVNYFRLDDFHRIFDRVIESGRIFGGQYLYVVADLGSLRQALPPAQPVGLPDGFLSSIERLGASRTGAGVVWGGASKGVIFALLMERRGRAIDTIIDINPAKQGKYIAATGLQVSTPEAALGGLPAGAPIYVMNSNYLPEIKDMTGNAYTYIGVDDE